MRYVVRSSNAPGAIIGFSDTPPAPPPEQPAAAEPLPPEARASQAALFDASAAPAAGTAARPVHTWRHTLALISAATVMALALFALVRGMQAQPRPIAPPATSPPLAAPTRAPATATATPAPSATPVLTTTPEPPTPEPPTPIVIVQPPIQCWTITIDVTDQHGTPIGIAEGASCESQEAARANALAHAAEVRATHERK